MKHAACGIAILLICTLLTGCTGIPQAPNAPNQPSTNGNVVFGPVDTMPAGSNVTIQVAQKDAIHNTIDVTFAGGEGQNQVKSIDVIYKGHDGVTQTQSLKPLKGATVTFQGTTQTDNIQVYVTLYNGNRYKVVDQSSPVVGPARGGI
ncbi:MAG TPA: hypothetical protein VMC42_10170 [Methanoregulaceae archaeon]|nr:hypothetical protein [Methanoregulaceae archaeon]